MNALGAEPAPEAGARDSLEWRLRAAIVVGVSLVFAPLFLHPTEVVYNDVSDLLAGHEPYRHLMVQSLLERGRLPRYDPTAFGGIPLLSDPQTGNDYPPNWLHVLGGPATYGWLIWAHVCLGGMGVLWWLRPWLPRAAPRLAAAFAFALAGKWLHHVVSAGHLIFLALAWVPWQLGWVDRACRTGSAHAVAMLAVVTALAVVGMHPQLLLYSQVLVVAYVALIGLRTEGVPIRLRLGALVGAGVLALAISASHLLPVLADLDAYIRGESLDYVEAAWLSLRPNKLIGLLLPSEAGGDWEASGFIGVAALALALFAPWSPTGGRLVGFGVGALVGCLWYALGGFGGPAASPVGSLHHLLFVAVPGFDLFRLPVRILVMAGIPLAVLAAAGLEALSARRSRSMAALALGLVAAGLGLLLVYRSAEALWALLALAAPAIALMPAPPRWRVAAPWLVVAILFADGARFVAPLLETRPLEEILGRNRVAEALRAPLGEGRVLALNGDHRADVSSLPSTYATREGIESLRGYNPLVPRATHDFLIGGAAQRASEGRHGSSTIPSFRIASRAHLDLFNTRWVVTHAPLSLQGLELRDVVRGQRVFLFQREGDWSEPRDAHLYENVRRMPRAALVRRARLVASADAAITAVGSFDPRREVLVEEASIVGDHPGEFVELAVEHRGDEIDVAVDAGEGGYLLLAEVAYPGWRAWDGAAPIALHRANGIFQVLHLGPGSHEIHLSYAPRAYDVGLLVALIGFATIVALWILGRRD